MGECPTGWLRVTIGDVVTLQRGHDITRAEQRQGSIPVVSSGGISSWHDQAMASGPGVVLGRKGTLGRTYYVDRDYWPHDTTLWVRDFKGNHPRFVYYFFSNLDFRYLDVGSANPTLNRNHVHPLPTVWPPLSEQRAIAEVLGALDDKIEANRRTIDRALAFGIQCAQSATRDVQLSDMASIKRNTLSPSSFSGDEVDHFSLPAFDDGQVPVRELGSNIKSGKQEVTNTLVLVSKLNPHIPRIWYAMAQSGVRAVASTEFVCLQARGDATAEELWACCSTREFTEQLQERVTGTTGSHQRVRPEDMMTLTIADPTALPETTRSALREAVSLGEALRHETQSLAALRDVLLPRLMSGQLRIRDAEHLVEDAV